MRSTGIGTSLMLIAIGAILAFAINFDTNGSIDLNAIGGILMIVGLVGLVLSFVALGDWGWFGTTDRHVATTGHGHYDAPAVHHDTVVTTTTPHAPEETVVRREERVTRQ
jgi:hypothetical protein